MAPRYIHSSKLLEDAPVRRFAIAGLCSLLTAATSTAQRKSLISGGSIYRYLGDTIWVERDTTVRRTIFRGDTIVKTSWLNGGQLSSQIYVAMGDSARLIAVGDSAGRVSARTIPRALPLRGLTIEREMLETQLRMQALMSQVA